MRPVRLFLLVLLAAALGGCASAQRMASAPTAQPASLDSLALAKQLPPQAASARAQGVLLPNPILVTPEAAAAAFEGEPPYTVDTGDRLRVVIFGQDGLTNSYTVDASGAITLPLISVVPARGLTTDELARAVAERLRRGFVREPHVAIEVETYRPFFILGEVIVPGQYAYVPHMTVENAIAIAGGFTPRAYRFDIRIDRPVTGGVARKSVPPLTRVRPGDTIVIAERWF